MGADLLVTLQNYRSVYWRIVFGQTDGTEFREMRFEPLRHRFWGVSTLVIGGFIAITAVVLPNISLEHRIIFGFASLAIAVAIFGLIHYLSRFDQKRGPLLILGERGLAVRLPLSADRCTIPNPSQRHVPWSDFERFEAEWISLSEFGLARQWDHDRAKYLLIATKSGERIPALEVNLLGAKKLISLLEDWLAANDLPKRNAIAESA